MIPDDEQEFALRMERATTRAIASVNGIDRSRLTVRMTPADEKEPAGSFQVTYEGCVEVNLWAHFIKVFQAEYRAEFDLTAEDDTDDADWWKK